MEPKRKTRRNEYNENDLRYLLQLEKEEEKSPYQILFEKGYIEDVSKWIEMKGL